ncbi:hypothetical protein [Psychrosphaera algicola]|uniref:Uncharacterized protein n=1 Tax=Psychrosphaera algicola TaxID=3023714 RepID=A0ABT5F824_9GAMM|nr:hypothetical protein [Psychrosphaera sp. G1-22]MDC2887686.1 hypothetical protein [Psychrosphaera sp. G1-22]
MALWNGPSPNLSMQIKDQYPRNGDFAIRVKASKGYAFDVLALNAKSLTNAKPLAELDKNNTSLKKPAKGVNRFVVLAKNAKRQLVLKNQLKRHKYYYLVQIVKTCLAKLWFRHQRVAVTIFK